MRTPLALALILAVVAPALAQDSVAEIGHLRARKQELDKKIIGGYLAVDADLAFAKLLADKARENGKRLGGEFEQKFEEDANTIEWDAQTKANEKKAELDRAMEPTIRESKELDEKINRLVDAFLASPEGKVRVAAMRKGREKVFMKYNDRELVLHVSDYAHQQAPVEKQAGE